jgi:hypothetical protein
VTDNEIVIGGDAADIPPGTYAGKLKSMTTKYSERFGGEFRVWDFELANGSVVGGSTSMRTNPKSKGGKWIAALLGRQPKEGESVTLIGKPCLVVVGLKDEWPAVTDVLPPMATPVAAAAPAAIEVLP